MLKFSFFILTLFFAICAGNAFSYAADPNTIDSVTVLADSRLALPLAQISSRFSSLNMISISNVFGTSPEQVKKIEDGDSADLFITADPALIEQLKIKGLTDVYTETHIAGIGQTHFTAVVVASENMTSARSFLTYLKSKEAQEIFKRNGLTPP